MPMFDQESRDTNAQNVCVVLHAPGYDPDAALSCLQEYVKVKNKDAQVLLRK